MANLAPSLASPDAAEQVNRAFYGPSGRGRVKDTKSAVTASEDRKRIKQPPSATEDRRTESADIGLERNRIEERLLKPD